MAVEIIVERQVSEARIAELGARAWPIWEKEVSCFPAGYDEPETCLFLAGEVTVTPSEGAAVTLHPGDVAVFPAGLDCTWDIKADIRKHYRFG
jgi:uncharacterized protein